MDEYRFIELDHDDNCEEYHLDWWPELDEDIEMYERKKVYSRYGINSACMNEHSHEEINDLISHSTSHDH